MMLYTKIYVHVHSVHCTTTFMFQEAVNIAEQARAKYGAALAEKPADMLENVTRAVKLATYNTTMNIARTKYIDDNTDEFNHELAMLECKLTEILGSYMFWVDKELFDSNYTMDMGMVQYYEEQLVNTTVAMTTASLLLTATYPEFACMQDMYYNFLYYLKQRLDPSVKGKPNSDWFFDSERMWLTSKEDRMSCGPENAVNKCLKKLVNTCKKERYNMKLANVNDCPE